MKIKMNNAVGPQVRSAKPKPSKLLPILGGVFLVGGLQAATQFFAYTFQYHASLGANLWHVYAPWSILNWSAKWYSQYPDEIMRAGSIGMVTATVGLLGVAVAKVVTSNSSKANEYLHGSARWAEKKDIQTAGLLPRERNVLEIVTGKDAPTATGVYVGGWQDKDGNFFYLRHSGPEHVLTYAHHRLEGRVVGADRRLAAEAREEQGAALRAGQQLGRRVLEPAGRNPAWHRGRSRRRAEPSNFDS
jgi:type IV secretion system protein VirD4